MQPICVHRFWQYLAGCGTETEALIHEALRLSTRIMVVLLRAASDGQLF
jgi:hypothetical protein